VSSFGIQTPHRLRPLQAAQATWQFSGRTARLHALARRQSVPHCIVKSKLLIPAVALIHGIEQTVIGKGGHEFRICVPSQKFDLRRVIDDEHFRVWIPNDDTNGCIEGRDANVQIRRESYSHDFSKSCIRKQPLRIPFRIQTLFCRCFWLESLSIETAMTSTSTPKSSFNCCGTSPY